MDKLREAGIISKTTGWNGGYIQLVSYTSEVEFQLEKERQEWIEAKKIWDEKHPTESVT